MRLVKRIFCITLLSIGLNSYAQQEEKFAQNEEDQHELSDEKKEKMADRLMQEGSYYSAVDYYKEVWEKDSSRYDLKYKMGLAYYFSRDYENAEPWFEKAVKLEPKAKTLAYYYYGESLRHNMKYELAKKQYTAFKKIKYKGSDYKLKKKLNAQHIKACDYAIQNIKKPVSAEVKNLGDNVNSNYSDFSPWLVSDSTLIYASLRSDTVLHAHAHTSEFYPVHLYETKKEGETWGEPVKLDRNFNKHFHHSANAVYTKDGKTMYYTQCKPMHDKVKCHIYKSELEEGEWSHPKKVHDKINKGKYTSTMPAIGYYSKKVKREMKEIPVLYFASDRPKSKGGLDIWYAEMNDDGHFKAPKNCGSKINTPGDDLSPFYNQKEQTLYFSSNYHLGFGGFDAFKSKGKTKSFQKAENVGFTLNSSLDDTYFSIDSVGEKGFLVSNRTGGHALKSETCCDDIYEYQLVPEKELPLDGFAFDSTGDKNKPLLDAKVALYLVNEDGEDSLINTITTSKDATHYAFIVDPNKEYYFKGEKEGYESEHFSFNTSHIEDEDTLHINYPMWPGIDEPADTPVVAKNEPIEEEKGEEPEEEVEEPKEDIKTPGFVLKNVLHDFDVAAHSGKTGINIDDVIKVMKENPWLVISIESHTDSKGTDEYNMKLSERRAKSCKTYLLRQGISGTRIKAKWFGETNPVASNTKPDGSDNPEGRAQNRRTEFKVVSNTPAK